MERTTTTNWQNGKLTQWILPFVVFGALWLMLIRRLSLYWATYPQYAFGWFVPFICAYLFLIRWKSRPAGCWALKSSGCPSARFTSWVEDPGSRTSRSAFA